MQSVCRLNPSTSLAIVTFCSTHVMWIAVRHALLITLSSVYEVRTLLLSLLLLFLFTICSHKPWTGEWHHKSWPWTVSCKDTDKHCSHRHIQVLGQCQSNTLFVWATYVVVECLSKALFRNIQCIIVLLTFVEVRTCGNRLGTHFTVMPYCWSWAISQIPSRSQWGKYDRILLQIISP